MVPQRCFLDKNASPVQRMIGGDGAVRWWAADAGDSELDTGEGAAAVTEAGSGVRTSESESDVEWSRLCAESPRTRQSRRPPSRSSSASSKGSAACHNVGRASSASSEGSAACHIAGALSTELEVWAWEEAHHASFQDVALILWCLAAVNGQNKELTDALVVRANAKAGGCSGPDMAIMWKALADLGAAPQPATVEKLLVRMQSLASEVTERQRAQMIRDLRACGLRPRDSPAAHRAIAALKSASTTCVDECARTQPR